MQERKRGRRKREEGEEKEREKKKTSWTGYRGIRAAKGMTTNYFRVLWAPFSNEFYAPFENV